MKAILPLIWLIVGLIVLYEIFEYVLNPNLPSLNPAAKPVSTPSSAIGNQALSALGSLGGAALFSSGLTGSNSSGDQVGLAASSDDSDPFDSDDSFYDDDSF